jgi:hypothetical protein
MSRRRAAGRRNFKAEEMVRRDGRTYAGRAAWFATARQAEAWLTALGAAGDVDLWQESSQQMFACSRRRSDGTWIRRGPVGEWLIDGLELATPLISAFADPDEHILTIAPGTRARMVLTCSRGCDLGTSAFVAGFAEGSERADLHRHAVACTTPVRA